MLDPVDLQYAPESTALKINQTGTKMQMRQTRLTRTAAVLMALATVFGLGALFAATPASAVARTYNVNGTFTYAFGEITAIGSFTFDPDSCTSNPCPNAYSNVSFTFTPDFADPNYPVTLTSPRSDSTDQALILEQGSVMTFTLSFDAPVAPSPVPVINTAATSLVTEGGPEDSESFDPVTVDPLPTPTPTPTPTPSPTAALTVESRAANKKLPKAGKATVVHSAGVSPSSAGGIRSIRVSCNSRARGDIKYCRYSKNLGTGKVTVTTLGKAKLTVKVTIKTKSTSPSYQAQTWSQTWKTK